MKNGENSTLSDHKVVEFMFKEVIAEIRSENDLTPESIKTLQLICGNILCPALDLVDKDAIWKVKSSQGRSVFQIRSEHEQYTCLKREMYCHCRVFTDSVINKRTSFLCKHLLAVFVACALDKVQIDVMEPEFVEKLLQFSIT
eukprot:sb/3474092/